jgi:hypothetical protein
VKRRGIDLGSDESGSEDEDADRRRRKSIKKPRFDDGKLEGIGRRHYYFPTFNALPADALIGRDVDPTAFLRVYTSHLEEDDEPIFREDEDSQMAERDDEDDEEDGGEPGETISRRELEAQIRQAAKEKVVFQAPLDVTMDDG